MACRLCLAWERFDPDELLEELTLEQFQIWTQYYAAEPWGEARADQRQAAGILWLLAPHLQSEADLPDLHYPYFQNETDDEFVARAKRIAQAAKSLADGNDNQPISDCPGA